MKILFAILVIGTNQVAVYFESKDDARRQLRGRNVEHIISAMIRAAAWIATSIFINIMLAIDFNSYIASAACMTLMLGFSYWLTFDYMHNRWTGKQWWYTNDGPFDNILDKYDQRYKRLTLKAASFLLFLILYFIV